MSRVHRTHRAGPRARRTGVACLAAMAVGLGGCSSLFSVSSTSTSTTGATTTATGPAANGTDVAFPVARCTVPPPPSTTTTTNAFGTALIRPTAGGPAGSVATAEEMTVHRPAAATGGAGAGGAGAGGPATRDTTPTTPTTPVPVTQPGTPTVSPGTTTPTTPATPTTAPRAGATTPNPSPYRGTTPTTPSTGYSGGGSATVSESGHGWVPSVLLAPLPTSLVGQVEFYSDGVHTVLAPAGWTCSIMAGGSAASGLAVYPSGTVSPPVTFPPPGGTEGVFAVFTNTGSSAGVGFVCPYFAVADWQKREAGCGNPAPSGQTFSMATPDVASVTDPAGIPGSLAGSGGSHAVTGIVIFPQIQPSVSYGTAINAAVESCSLVDAKLCPAILSDFSVREFPSPGS